MRKNYNYKKAYKYTINHKEKLIKDNVCGCVNCTSIFHPNEINEWIEDRSGTAICPYCNIDSVIGEHSGFPITKTFMREIHKYWFKTDKEIIMKDVLLEDILKRGNRLVVFNKDGKDSGLFKGLDDEWIAEKGNLWTYWQGLNHKKIKFMIVGQDYGSLAYSDPLIQKIKSFPNLKKFTAKDNLDSFKNIMASDKNLIRYIHILDDKYDIHENNYDDLYFTNFIPLYRTSKTISGGNFKLWSSECRTITGDYTVRDYFKELVDYLQPENIICLGKDVYEECLSALDTEFKPISNYNDFLNEQLEGKHDHSYEINDMKINLFAVAHPGFFGESNRKRSQSGHTSEEDWLYISNKVFNKNRRLNNEEILKYKDKIKEFMLNRKKNGNGK
ncbi:MAG: hypothetical protein Q4B60_00245 [Erysipelotrichaceae bacterium]|nr:hypothetical protein [Erysipelotrichaceae bacterium]